MTDHSHATFDFDGFRKLCALDISTSLHLYVLALTSNCQRLAMATTRHLLITDDVHFDGIASEGGGGTIETVFEFGAESGNATVLRWLTDDVVCCGFSSGDFACFDCDGIGIIEQRCDDSPVQSLRLAECALIPSLGVGIMCLWILHESGVLAVVPIDSLLEGHVDDLIRLKSLNQTQVGDMVLLPSLHALGQSSDSQHSVLLGGLEPALALYNLGGKQHFEHLGKLATYYSSKVGGYLSRTLSSFFGGSTRGKSSKSAAQEREAVPISSVLDFQDSKRKVLRLSLDPSGRFVAAADNMGRVMLYDVRINCVIRVWKGVRGARLAWAEGWVDDGEDGREEERIGSSSYSRRCKVQCLAIYAPRTGMLSMYALRHGACLRSLPVGLYCQITTLLLPARDEHGKQGDDEAEKLGHCCLLRAAPHEFGVEILILNPFSGADQVLLARSTSSFSSARTPSPSKSSSSAHSCQGGTPSPSKSDPSGSLSLAGSLVGSLGGSSSSPNSSGQIASGTVPSPLSGDDTDEHASERIVSLLYSLRDVRPGTLISRQEEVEALLSAALDGISTPAAAKNVLSLIQRTELGASVLLYRNASSLVNSPISVSYPAPLQPPPQVPEAAPGSDGFRQLRRGLAVLSIPPSSPLLSEQSPPPLLQTTPTGMPAHFGGPSLNFSHVLHGAINDMLLRIANGGGEGIPGRQDAEDRAELLQEATSRHRLLLAYDALRSFASGNATSHISSIVSLNQPGNAPLVASICRQNGRGEALSWILRSMRLSGAHEAQESGMPAKNVVSRSPNLSSSFTPLQTLRSASLLHSSLNAGTRDDWVSRSRSNSNSVSRSPSTSSFNLFSPIGGQGGVGSYSRSSSLGSFGEAESMSILGQDNNSAASFPSFSLFRLMHCKTRGHSEILFQSEGLLAACRACESSSTLLTIAADPIAVLPLTLSTSTTISRSSPSPSTPTLGSLSGALDSLVREAAPVKVSVALSILKGFLPLLTSPLIGDAFSLPSVLAAWTRMGLHQVTAATTKPSSSTQPLSSSPSRSSGYFNALPEAATSRETGQTSVLRLFFQMLTTRPAGQVVSTLLLRSMATSPLQRWLRDELVAVCELYANYFSILERQRRERGGGMAGPDTTLPEGSAFGPALVVGSAEWNRMAALCNDVTIASAAATSQDLSYGQAKATSPLSAKTPTLDEILRQILRPVWRDVCCSPNLDTAHAFAAVVAETVLAVSEQIEHKSYGLHAAHSTIAAWENICRMLRVAQVVHSRRLVSRLTVEKLGCSCKSTSPDEKIDAAQKSPRVLSSSAGSQGIFRVLAEDTLSFSLSAEAAAQHEQRCWDIISKKQGGGASVAPAPPASGGDGLLQAWGTVSDRRWRDLLALMESDDASAAAETAPIPIPSSPSPKAAKSPLLRNNSFETLFKDTKDTPKLHKRRPLLLLFPRHVGQRACLAAYRAWALADKFHRKVAKSQFLGLAASHLFTLQPVMRAAVASSILQSTVLPLLLQVALLEEEPLSPVVLSQNKSIDVGEMMGLFSGSHPDFIRGASELLLYLDASVTTRSALPEIATAPSVFDDETPRPVWPPVDDFALQRLVNLFVARNDESGGPVPSSVRRKAKDYTALLWVQVLRFSCNLRGIKASALFPHDFLRTLLEDSSMLGVGLGEVDVLALAAHILTSPAASPLREARVDSPNPPSNNSLVSTRLDFLNLCFTRFRGDSPLPIYRLAEIFGLHLDTVKILHADNLCAQGESDEEVSHLIAQVLDKRSEMVDRLTARLRARIATSILPLKNREGFGPILASLNGVAWEWIQGHSIEEGGGSHAEGSGKQNIASTRQLLLCLQTICNKEKNLDDAWFGRRKKIELMLELSLALLNAMRIGLV